MPAKRCDHCGQVSELGNCDLELPFKMPTLNEFFSSGHWATRQKMKSKLETSVKLCLLASKMQPIRAPIEIIYEAAFKGRRFDATNLAAGLKMTEDAMRDMGILENDSPIQIPRVSLIPTKGEEDRSRLWLVPQPHVLPGLLR